MFRGLRFDIRATAVALMSGGLIAMTVVFAEPPPSGPKSDQPVAEKEIETRVRQLVESMTDPKEQVRDSAYGVLKSLGERALPTLKRLAAGDSPQVTAARRGIYAIKPDLMRKGPGRKDGQKGIIKPTMADTIKANIYADNWFILYINGKLTAVDSIDFIPHNVISVDILPDYPMTIAVLAKDNAHPSTGLEYSDHIGDGGFILRFGDGTVTNATWKAKCFSRGPIDRDVKNPKVRREPIPRNWWAVDFDDSQWP